MIEKKRKNENPEEKLQCRKAKATTQGIMNWKQYMGFMAVSTLTIMEDKPLAMNKNIHSLSLPRIKFQCNTLVPFSAILPVSLPNPPAYVQLTERFPIQGELCSRGRISLCSHLSQCLFVCLFFFFF